MLPLHAAASHLAREEAAALLLLLLRLAAHDHHHVQRAGEVGDGRSYHLRLPSASMYGQNDVNSAYSRGVGARHAAAT